MRNSGAVDVREVFGNFPRVGHEGVTVGVLHFKTCGKVRRN